MGCLRRSCEAVTIHLYPSSGASPGADARVLPLGLAGLTVGGTPAGLVSQMAMGRNLNRTPSEHPNPTTEFTYQPKWDPKDSQSGFEPQPDVQTLHTGACQATPLLAGTRRRRRWRQAGPKTGCSTGQRADQLPFG